MLSWLRKKVKVSPGTDGSQVSACNQSTSVKCHSAAKRAVKRNKSLAPADSSVQAYVAWLRANGGFGQYYQSDLWAEYLIVCQWADLRPVPARHFGKDLGLAGCRRWQADDRHAGEGSRPMMVEISRKPLATVVRPLAIKRKRVAAERPEKIAEVAAMLRKNGSRPAVMAGVH